MYILFFSDINLHYLLQDNPLATFAELISIKHIANTATGGATSSLPQKKKKQVSKTPASNSKVDNTLLYLLMAKLPLVRDLRKLLKEEEEEARKKDKKAKAKFKNEIS